MMNSKMILVGFAVLSLILAACSSAANAGGNGSAGLTAGEEVTLRGEVVGTIDDCAFDGICALVIETEQGRVDAIWAEGMLRCEGSFEDGIQIGDTIAVFGIVRSSSEVSICPSADYYINTSS
ncbi:MAG: hypothetical protein ACFB51_19420 [Anaerolineae bacterium]